MLNQVVNTAPPVYDTSTGLTSSADPSTFGEATTYTAVVTAASPGGTPTGTVQFSDGATTFLFPDEVAFDNASFTAK